MSKMITVFDGIIDTAAREHLSENRTLAGIEQYADGIDVALTPDEVQTVFDAIKDWSAYTGDEGQNHLDNIRETLA